MSKMTSEVEICGKKALSHLFRRREHSSQTLNNSAQLRPYETPIQSLTTQEVTPLISVSSNSHSQPTSVKNASLSPKTLSLMSSYYSYFVKCRGSRSRSLRSIEQLQLRGMQSHHAKDKLLLFRQLCLQGCVCKGLQSPRLEFSPRQRYE